MVYSADDNKWHSTLHILGLGVICFYSDCQQNEPVRYRVKEYGQL